MAKLGVVPVGWKLKAGLLRVMAGLPDSIADMVYYRVQRTLGALRAPLNPMTQVRSALEIAKRAERNGVGMAETRVVEIGTGRRLGVPIVLWLLGADDFVTVDINRYLRDDLVREDLAHLLGPHRAELVASLAGLAPTEALEGRLSLLDALVGPSAEDVGKILGLRYAAPADARSLPLPDASVDLHVSVAVMEHVVPDVLLGILTEGKRVLRPGGLMIHYINPGDHFARGAKVHTANFLQYDDDTWGQLADNRYAYVNRLREDDYCTIFEKAGVRILEWEAAADPIALAALRNDFPVADRFRRKTPETNAVDSLWVVGA